MLHGDRAERGERLGLVKHPLGDVGVESDPLPFAGPERPGLVPNRVGHAEAAEVMDQTGAAEGASLPLGQSEPAGRRRRELRHRAGMAECVGRFEIDEVGHRQQRCVESLTGQDDRQRRLGADHRLPGGDVVESRENPLCLHVQQLRHVGVKLLSGALARELPDRSNAADPVRDLAELGQHGQARGSRDLVPLEPLGPPAPVPRFVGASEAGENVVGELELLAQDAGHGGVVGDHLVHLAIARDGELQPDAKAVQRRIARPEPTHPGGRTGHAAPLVLVLLRLQTDVVSEPLGLLMGIRMAADVDQQGGVVNRRPRLLIESHPLGQSRRDPALAQDVLHRLTESEIDPQRQRGHELGQP